MVLVVFEKSYVNLFNKENKDGTLKQQKKLLKKNSEEEEVSFGTVQTLFQNVESLFIEPEEDILEQVESLDLKTKAELITVPENWKIPTAKVSIEQSQSVDMTQGEAKLHHSLASLSSSSSSPEISISKNLRNYSNCIAELKEQVCVQQLEPNVPGHKKPPRSPLRKRLGTQSGPNTPLNRVKFEFPDNIKTSCHFETSNRPFRRTSSYAEVNKPLTKMPMNSSSTCLK